MERDKVSSNIDCGRAQAGEENVTTLPAAFPQQRYNKPNTKPII